MGEINRCVNCNCECHCSLMEHSDMLGVCPCTACSCSQGKEEDQTYESGGIVVDDTGDCDSCQ